MRLTDFIHDVAFEFYKQHNQRLDDVHCGKAAMDELIRENPNKQPGLHGNNRTMSFICSSGYMVLIEEGNLLFDVQFEWQVHNCTLLTYTDIIFDRCDKPVDLVKHIQFYHSTTPTTLTTQSVITSLNNYNPGGIWGTVDWGSTSPDPSSKPKGCDHKWQFYQGLNHSDYFCTKCNEKRDAKP